MKMLEKCVRNAVKTMVVDRKNQKALALLYLASKPLRTAATQAVSRPSLNRTDETNLNFLPELYRLTFPLPPKRQLSVLLNFFFHKQICFWLLLSLLVLLQRGATCDFVPKTHGIQHRVISSVWSALVTLWCGRTDGRTDGRTYLRTYGRSRHYNVTTKIS